MPRGRDSWGRGNEVGEVVGGRVPRGRDGWGRGSWGRGSWGMG